MIVWSYFKPLRKKLGVIVLVIACVAMLGWLRSRKIDDTLTLFANDRSMIQLISRESTVGVRSLSSQYPLEPIKDRPDRFLVRTGKQEVRPTRIATSIDEYTMSALQNPYKWRFNAYGFGIGGVIGDLELINVSVWKIPCWAIVIPLTLVSALLLFSKPRDRSFKPATNS